MTRTPAGPLLGGLDVSASLLEVFLAQSPPAAGTRQTIRREARLASSTKGVP